MSKGKYLALDYGQKRVGVAISDEDKLVAFPRDFLLNDETLIPSIKSLCEQEHVLKVIIGLPVEMDGNFGPQAEKTQTFGEKLQNELSIPVEYFDERLTTTQTQRSLQSYGIKAKDQKQGIDSASAQLILSAYLKTL